MCYDQEKTQGLDEKLRAARGRNDLREPAGQVGCALSDSEILARLFTYHPPTPPTLPKYAAINQAAKNFAEIVLQNLPPCADRTAAIRQIQDARMTANRGVALDGLSL